MHSFYVFLLNFLFPLRKKIIFLFISCCCFCDHNACFVLSWWLPLSSAFGLLHALPQAISSEEYLYFEVKNKNLADRASVGMGKVPLR